MSVSVHPLLERVFIAFERANINWLILRDELALVAPHGDVDLLLDPDSARRAHRLLRSLGFVRLATLGRGSHTFYLGFHGEDGRWIKLDIVTELAFGPYFALQTQVMEGCLSRRRRDGAFATLASDDAFWTLLLHSLLDKREVVPRHAPRLRQLSGDARTDGPWKNIVASACPPGWSAQRIVDSVTAGNWTALAALAPELAATWRRRDRLRVLWHITKGRIGGILEKPRAVLGRPPMSVALLGADGVGKSTLAAAIQSSFPLPTHSIYMGMWQRPARALRSAPPGLDHLGRLVRLWRRYLVGQYHRARRRLVVFDRYSYDALLPPREERSRFDQVNLWVLGHACPPPDLVLLLDAAGEVAHARKDEYSASQLEADRARFLALLPLVPRLEVVDASRSQEAVRADVIGRIWQRYVDRWTDDGKLGD